MVNFFIFVVFLFCVVYLDANLLKRRNMCLYGKIFKFSPWIWALVSMTFILPIYLYLLKRKRFKELLSLTKHDMPEEQQVHKLSEGSGKDSLPDQLSYASDATGIILLWIAISLIATVILDTMLSFYPTFDTKLDKILLCAVFEPLLMVILIYQATKRYPDLGFWGILGLNKEKKSFVKVILIPVIVGLSFAGVSAWIIVTRQIQPSTPLSQILESVDSPFSILLFIGLAVCVAPFLEEIIFRGYFFHVIQKFKGTTFAVIFIASTFSLLHVRQYWGDWPAIFMIAVLGFILTFFRAWTGTTLSSIVTHYIYNGFVTIITVVMMVCLNPAYFQYQISYSSLDTLQREKLLFESIRDNPKFSHAYNDLAWLYAQENKNLDAALMFIEKALFFDPQNSAYLDTKAEVLYKLRRFDEALDIEKRLVEDHPGNVLFKKQLEKFQRALQAEDLSKVK